jgi:hypothetical protein
MKINIILSFIFILNGCKVQEASTEIIDPVSKLPFEVTLKEKYINFSELDSTISSGLLDIAIQIDSVGNVSSYLVQVVRLNYQNKDSKLFVNGNPRVPNDKIDIIKTHLTQIDFFISEKITVSKKNSTSTNKNIMKVPILVR